MSSYFEMKANKRKVRKYLKCANEFARKFDSANGKYFSISLRAFAKIAKVTTFCAGYQFLRKVRESTIFCFLFIFSTQQQNKVGKNGNRQRNNMIKSK